jgi:putative FmdB family regulatory protein
VGVHLAQAVQPMDFGSFCMPIYAYRCDGCGYAKDVLQKISDAPLTDCPSCGTAGAFKKQLTAPGFQLKGSGWYVTDFRGGNQSAPAANANGTASSASGGDGGSGSAGASKESAAAPAASSASTSSASSSES